MQQIIDTYYAFSNTDAAGNFYTLGFTSVDSNDYAVVASYGSPGLLTDRLPEASGQSWSNVATEQINTQNTEGITSQQNYNADGTYSEEINFPSNGAGAGATPNPGATSSIVQNRDGSGTYAADRNGNARTGDVTYSFATPNASADTITITTNAPPVAPPSPGATPAVTSTTIPDWIPSGYLGSSLVRESDVDNGSKTIPSACSLPAAFGSTANQIVQTRNRVDTILGEVETYTLTFYDIANVGPACTILHDVVTQYYDYTGQTYPGYWSGSPLAITTVDETLALTGEQLMYVKRHPAAREALSRAYAFRAAELPARLAAFQARRRLQIERRQRSLQLHAPNPHHLKGFAR